MFKRISCFLLIVLMGCTTFTRLFYFAGYELNKEYIATVLCVNKDKPELNCNGKCFLTRKIAEAEKKQQSQERKTQKDLSQQIMLIASFKINFLNVVHQSQQINYTNNYSFSKTTSFYHPPPTV